MVKRTLARDALWQVATEQRGFVTAQQASVLGIAKNAVQMLVHRGTLVGAAHGVYRFPQYPVGLYDEYMLAVLWTRAPEACLSHETALDAYGITDINPHRIHITVDKRRRLRRMGGDDYVIHYEELTSGQTGWWEEIPTVTPATAIAQCIVYGTPTYLLRQGLERGLGQGYLRTDEHNALAEALEIRHDQ